MTEFDLDDIINQMNPTESISKVQPPVKPQPAVIPQPPVSFVPQPQYVPQQVAQMQPNYFQAAQPYQNYPNRPYQAAPMQMMQPMMQPPLMQPTMINKTGAFQTPEEAEDIDVTKVVIDAEKKWQIYVGKLPNNCTEQELIDNFKCFGEIKNVHLKNEQHIGFINFAKKEGAMNALNKRDIYIRAQPVTLAGFHQKLQIILRRIPPSIKLTDEARFQGLLNNFLVQKAPGIFVYAQLHEATYGSSAYLHFLCIEDSITAFNLLKTTEFTEYCARELQLVQDIANLKIVDNAEVDRRQKASEQPNQDLSREMIQFLCVRFVERAKQQARVGQPIQQQYQQQVIQQQQYPQQYGQMVYQQQQMYGQSTAPQGQPTQPQQQYQPYPVQRNAVTGQAELSVYIKGLTFGTQDMAIRQAMSMFGQVNHVQLINNQEAMGKPPCAICHYSNKESATSALTAGQVIINGQMARISPHVKKSM